jgi:DNA mismatch repair ATPase MutS
VPTAGSRLFEFFIDVLDSLFSSQLLNDRKNEVFQKTVRSFQKGNAQYEALKEELRKVKDIARRLLYLSF